MSTTDPTAPQSDETTDQPTEAPTTDDLLHQVLSEQQAHRAEVAQLRQELAAQKQQPQVVNVQAAPQLSAEERIKARLEEMAKKAFYCPGCGKLSDYPRECVGGEAGHPPIEMVSTDEIKSGDPSQHTAAPTSDGVRVVAA
jgi:hypothetical protein